MSYRGRPQRHHNVRTFTHKAPHSQDEALALDVAVAVAVVTASASTTKVNNLGRSKIVLDNKVSSRPTSDKHDFGAAKIV